MPSCSRSCPRINQQVDSSHRKDLDKTKQLLQEAKQLCPVETVSVKIQLALAEIDRVILASSSLELKANRLSSDHYHPSPGLDDLFGDDDTMTGNLWKRGSRLRQMIKRHYVLQGNFLYYYAYVCARGCVYCVQSWAGSTRDLTTLLGILTPLLIATLSIGPRTTQHREA